MKLSEEPLASLREGRNFTAGEAAAVFEVLIRSTDIPDISAVLDAWAAKGVSGEELSACTRIMRRNAFRVVSERQELLDIVGTGGSRSKLFNVSTAAAFVAAGAGVSVAKHGNKAASSKTGSADALSFLGVNITENPALAAKHLDEIGICFMFAPKFHNLQPELAAARKSLGYPTLFNLLGPLANPAGAQYQLTGIWDKQLIEPMAQAVAELGTTKTWIVYAESGLDEISLEGKTFVAEIEESKIRHFEVTPDDFGMKTASIQALDGLTPEKSAAIVRSVLDGENPQSANTGIVVLNAAAAIFISGRAKNLVEAASMARESIECGAARQKLEELVARTNR